MDEGWIDRQCVRVDKITARINKLLVIKQKIVTSMLREGYGIDKVVTTNGITTYFWKKLK